MSLQYRAIWRDDRSDLIDSGRSTFQLWIKGKGIDFSVPIDGVQTSDSNELVVEHASEAETGALRIRLHEDRPVKDGEERWTTTVHWMVHANRGWIWIDVEWVSDSAFARPPKMAAPKLASMLLEGRSPLTFGPRLGPKPSRVGADDVDGLVALLFQQDRQVPVVIYSVDNTLTPPSYASRVQEAARRLAGCADIRMLTAESEPLFNDIMQPLSLSVFDGAVRVYLPAIDADEPNPWRHRYTRSRHLSPNPSIAADVIVRQVLPRMASLQPPTIYRQQIKQLLDRQRHDWETFAAELDQAEMRLTEEIKELQQQKEELQLEREIAYEEATESERVAGRARRNLESLRSHLRTLDEVPEVIEQRAEEEVEASSCIQAIELAQGFEHIAIHPRAPRDVDRMDESPDSELWARRVFRHLQALDAYAQEKMSGFSGSFVQWCQTSGSEHKISTKFVSMTESDWVRSNPRCRACRVLPIDPRVAGSTEIEMFAHLKTVQGGGTTIPRIYFHDDTMGLTKKVHIGFVGPHDLMPNKATN